MKLYDFFRSSSAFRVRIGLNLKHINYEQILIHLQPEGGEQFKPEYLAINPQGFVPTLRDGDHILLQSLAILEYLDELYPTPPFLPQLPHARARVRAISNIIACDIQPLNNMRVLRYVTHTLGHSEAEKNAWYYHWLHTGFKTIEQLLSSSPETGKCCHGDTPTLADIVLIPQYVNALRFEFPMINFPTIEAISRYCLTIPEFKSALPENQQFQEDD